MGNFGLVSQFPTLEFKYGQGPFAIIKVADRNLELIAVKRIFGKFFMTDLGVFELDGEYEYTLDGQTLYILNMHNCKPLSLRAIEDIQNKYKKGENKAIVDDIEEVEKAIAESAEKHSPVAILTHLANAEEGKGLKYVTKKFLVDQKLFDVSDAELFQSEALLALKALPRQSNKVSPIAPMGIFASIGIFTVLIMSQVMPKIMGMFQH